MDKERVNTMTTSRCGKGFQRRGIDDRWFPGAGTGGEYLHAPEALLVRLFDGVGSVTIERDVRADIEFGHGPSRCGSLHYAIGQVEDV